MTSELFRNLQLMTTGSLVTLIWMIQILHYPMFLYLNKETFHETMRFHQNRISYIVIPLMVTELFLSLYALASETSLNNILSLGCVIAIWASTFLIQVPLHAKLTFYDEKIIKSLINGNFLRTALWTIHFFIIV